MTTYKQDVGVDIGFRGLMIGLENGEKYQRLNARRCTKGKAKVYVDWPKNEIIIED